jgi:hypothetical protein
MNATYRACWYLELAEQNDAAARVGPVSAPAGYEGEWLRKDLQGCDPFDHPHRAGYNPPPRPAL